MTSSKHTTYCKTLIVGDYYADFMKPIYKYCAHLAKSCTFDHSGFDNVIIQSIDSFGKDQYKYTYPRFYQGATGVIIFYDVTNRSTFENLQERIKPSKRFSEDPLVVLIGNRCFTDKDDKSNPDGKVRQRKVSYDEGLKYAMKHGFAFFEASPESDTNITFALESLVRYISVYKDTSGIPEQVFTGPYSILDTAWWKNK